MWSAAFGVRSPACLLRLGRGVDMLASLPRPAFVYALPVWWLFSWVRGACWRGCFLRFLFVGFRASACGRVIVFLVVLWGA